MVETALTIGACQRFLSNNTDAGHALETRDLRVEMSPDIKPRITAKWLWTMDFLLQKLCVAVTPVSSFIQAAQEGKPQWALHGRGQRVWSPATLHKPGVPRTCPGLQGDTCQVQTPAHLPRHIQQPQWKPQSCGK